jgi:ParB-like chromosome segregation protein Spo0J
MNEACTLKMRQIIKNPALSLGMSQKDVGKYKKVAAAYGNVAPVIVSTPVNGGYLILDGSARLEACAQTGIGEIPAVMAQAGNEAGQLKLALMLSAMRDEGGALSEGALISRLINDYGVAPRELVSLLGKSKAWVSKRLSMDQNLSETVKGMVTDGTLCPRSAEEVAKIPMGVQAEFAANAVNAGLNKTEICMLVRRYKSTCSGDVRREVIKSPLEALSKTGERVGKKAAGSGLNGPGRNLGNAANYAAQMILKTTNMAENADEEALCAAEAQLSRLQDVSEETALILNKLLADVSLGKQEGERAW